MATEIQCQCGLFRARLKAFPGGTPGRLVCYCDDCWLGRLHRPCRRTGQVEGWWSCGQVGPPI